MISAPAADIGFVNGEHDLGVFDIHGIEAGIGAGMGLMMQHGAHGAIGQDGMSPVLQSLAECQVGHCAPAGCQPHPPAPSPTSQGAGAEHSGAQDLLRGRRYHRVCLQILCCGERPKGRPYNSASPRRKARQGATQMRRFPYPRRYEANALSLPTCAILAEKQAAYE